jgi:hypothetical protein
MLASLHGNARRVKVTKPPFACSGCLRIPRDSGHVHTHDWACGGADREPEGDLADRPAHICCVELGGPTSRACVPGQQQLRELLLIVVGSCCCIAILCCKLFDLSHHSAKSELKANEGCYQGDSRGSTGAGIPYLDSRHDKE